MKSKKSIAKLVALLEAHSLKKHANVILRSKTYAVVYTRVSSKEQAENNSSLEVQTKLCNEYAKRCGLIIKQSFGGTYESAKTDGRKAFQKMLAFVKKDKDIGFIIVYSLDRFSRTGPEAAQLCTELSSIGVIVKSATQEIDSSTPSGKFQENFIHMFNNYDNELRSSRTKINTREIILKGYWTYQTPIGYKNLKPKHKASEHVYVITEEAKWLKKMFQWKAEDVLTNKEIVARIKPSGLPITVKNFRGIISNPFYAGYVTGSLVKGKLILGHHPPLISLELFLKANNMLQTETRTGISKTHRVEELPLKIFAKAEHSFRQFTGYIKKGIWYYKARGTGDAVNINAGKLNGLFKNLLCQFEYRKEFKGKLKHVLAEKLKARLQQTLQDQAQLKKRISELENQQDELEEKYVFGKLDENLYQKFINKIRQDIVKFKDELDKYKFDSSNFISAIEKGLSIAENLSQLWLSSDFSSKQKLQYLVFPDGILYSKENEVVRTPRTNSLFSEIPQLVRVLVENKKGDLRKNYLLSPSVDP